MPADEARPSRQAPRRRWLGLYRLNRATHRDLGYLFFTLTVLYAVSGVAVNHVADWNPSYATTQAEVEVPGLAGLDTDQMEKRVVEVLRLDPAEVKGRHRPSRSRFIVFLPEGGEVNLQVPAGRGTLKRVQTRPFLFQANVLHLNHLKGVWTYVADAYSVSLLLLAVTGLFILQGKGGLGGRGKWLVGAGTVVPIAFIVYYAISRG